MKNERFYHNLSVDVRKVKAVYVSLYWIFKTRISDMKIKAVYLNFNSVMYSLQKWRIWVQQKV